MLRCTVGMFFALGSVYLPSPLSFILRPHPQYFDDFLLFEHLVHQSMLNVDAARIGSLQIAEETFKRRRGLERVFLKESQKFLHLLRKRSAFELLCIFDSILCIDESVAHGA